jgi:hypothetical protein
LHIQFGFKMADAFTHSGNAYAGALCLNRSELLSRDSFSLILNLKQNIAGGARKMDRRHFASGMAMNVGQGFLDDAKDRQLSRRPAPELAIVS